MKKIFALFLLLFVFYEKSVAADYIIDFGLVPDFEGIRQLIDLCTDFGTMERYRNSLESAGDLEDLRNILENIGFGEFRGCPESISGNGVKQIIE